jgi:TRAP-type mannitol/chloroaromatic compound transport system permease small subunit
MLILFSFGLLVIQGISQGIKDLAVITGARGDGVAVGAGGVPEPDDAHEGHA